MENIFFFIVQIAVLLFSVSIHESAHAWMADKFGDPTAKMMGRITLNPIPHIDPMWSIIIPIILYISGGPIFGGAKPVLVNMRNLRNPKKANIYISAAGPLSNIFTAIIASIFFLILKKSGFITINTINQSLNALFVKSGALPGLAGFLSLILISLILINLILAFFNLIPIPPLDGSGILEGFLKGEALRLYLQIKPYGFVILIALIYFKLINYIFSPIIKFFFIVLDL